MNSPNPTPPVPQASYMTINPRMQVAATHTIREDLLVDIDEVGYVVGIERIGGLVDMDTLVAVLRTVRIEAGS